MKRVQLGKTSLSVTIGGLGTGRESKFAGAAVYGKEHAVGLIARALDFGVNYIDTAPVYETEPLVAEGIKYWRREEVVIGTKSTLGLGIRAGWKTVVERTMNRLDESVKLFGYIDLYSLHYISAGVLPKAVEILEEPLQRAVEAGKVKHIGITETYPKDRMHHALHAARKYPLFETVMFGRGNYPKLLVNTMRSDRIGTLLMQVNSEPGVSPSAQTYTKALQATGADVVLVGTSNPRHLRDNIRELESIR